MISKKTLTYCFERGRVREADDRELDLALSSRLRRAAATPEESTVTPTPNLRKRLEDLPGIPSLEIEHAFDVVEERPLKILTQERLSHEINEALLIGVKRGKEIAHASDTAPRPDRAGLPAAPRPVRGVAAEP